MSLIGPAAASFALCLLAMFALRPVAIAVDLIDRPGGRKQHVGEIPVVGGLGMLLGMVLGMGLLPLPVPVTGALLASCALLVTVGLIDDRFGLSPWARLLAQIAAALLLVFGAQTAVTTLGEPVGVTIWLEGISSYAFTVLCVVAAVNAFNMLDGMDGLAGALAVVALGAIAIFAVQSGDVVALSISVVIMGAVVAFLLSNLPFEFNRGVRCFMGDSGSTLLGVSVAWLCIEISQGPSAGAKPITMLWVVAIPIYELIWTVIRRAARGIPPFRSDYGHFHHLVLRAGFGMKATFVVFVVLAIALAAFGIALDLLGFSDSWSLALFVVAGFLTVTLMYHPRLMRKLLPRAFRHTEPAISD